MWSIKCFEITFFSSLSPQVFLWHKRPTLFTQPRDFLSRREISGRSRISQQGARQPVIWQNVSKKLHDNEIDLNSTERGESAHIYCSQIVFGKIWQNRMLAPPPGALVPPHPWENPGSAAAFYDTSTSILYKNVRFELLTKTSIISQLIIR